VKPTTVDGKFSAALFMLKLGRVDLARYYLEQTLADQPTDEDMLAMRQQHGTGTFLQLTSIDELNPPAIELLERVNQAVQAHISQPGYADGLLDKLSGSPRERAEALSELRHLGADAVPAIVKRIAVNQTDDREILTLTLSRLGSAAIAPLVGALTSPEDEVRAVAARVLGQVGGQGDILWLLAPAFNPDETPGVQEAARIAIARLKYGSEKAVGRVTSDGAVRQLLHSATQHLSGNFRWPELYDDVDEIPVWTWTEEENTIVPESVSRTLASIFFAERLAREAAILAPDQEQPSVVTMASLLARGVELNDWELPLPNTPDGPLDLAIELGPEFNERVLQFAISNKITSSALGALQALGLNGSAQLLAKEPSQNVVLSSLDFPDHRVQFAAATTILNWEPTSPFRGARRVVEILARTLNSETTPASVVMDPNSQRANETASLFTELGFSASLAQTGQEGFLIAAERGNIELAILHPNVIRWELSQTIANLRADSRTASIPVIIYGPAQIHDRFDRFEQEFQNVVYLDEANVPVDLSRNLQPILAQLSPPPLSPPQRARQMADASFWLRRIAIRNVGNIFDLTIAEEAVSKALGKPELAEDALITLGAIGTNSAQRTLLAAATAPALDLPLRALAASQLAFHIQQHGLVLTPVEAGTIKTTFDSETDPNLRTALAAVIGTLKPSPAAVRNELLRRPMSPSPLPLPVDMAE